jgi:RNA polymerase sigma-32 factor
VVFIAREYQRNIQNILDLVQEGNIGLLAAVRQFDPYKGIRFPSYATYWIRAYMLRFIINNLRLVKIGTTQVQRKLFYNLQKEKDKVVEAGFVPEAKLLAEKLNVKESEVIEMEQRLALPDASLDAPLIKDDDGSQTLLGVLPDHNSDVENNVVDRQFVNSIRDEIELLKPKLDAKEKDIVENRLCADEPQSLQEIGEKHGVSRERIRQIETKLKEKLKTHLSKKLNLNHKGDVINA